MIASPEPSLLPAAEPCADPGFVARCLEGSRRVVPGHQDVLRMAAMLLGEDAPRDAEVLVVGAGVMPGRAQIIGKADHCNRDKPFSSCGLRP